jgi:uncharacterized membrane protein
MKKEQDYIRDIADMRSMMERSSKYLSLSGLGALLAGIYALVACFFAYKVFGIDPSTLTGRYSSEDGFDPGLVKILLLAAIVLIVSLATIFYLSYKKANRSQEKFWNPTAKRVLLNMAIPLMAGGILILIMAAKGLPQYMAPLSLLFYGLAFFNASKFTLDEVRSMAIIEMVLGLLSTWFVEYSLWFWALGFGIVHIVYGIFIYYRYER